MDVIYVLNYVANRELSRRKGKRLRIYLETSEEMKDGERKRREKYYAIEYYLIFVTFIF